MNIIILISGKSNSGKGTVANILAHKLQECETFNIIRCSLSSYIRDIAKKDFYWNGEDTPESRKFMAEVYRIGTEFYKYHMARRVWERDIHPRLIKEKILIEDLGYPLGMLQTGEQRIKVDKNIVIVESFRELQNYEYFEQLFIEDKIQRLITLRINSNKYSKIEDNVKNHVSEIGVDNFDFDYYIENEGTHEELKNKVDCFIKYHLQ